MAINYYTLLVIIPILHLLAFIWPVLKPIIVFIVEVLATTTYLICKIVSKIGFGGPCNKPPSLSSLWNSIGDPFKKITLPNLSYPDCQLCDCGKAESTGTSAATQVTQDLLNSQVTSPNADFFTATNWISGDDVLQLTLNGTGTYNGTVKTPVYKPKDSGYSFIDNLPIWETVNKFNLKSKYFDSMVMVLSQWVM